jgi:hypothetical protein
MAPLRPVVMAGATRFRLFVWWCFGHGIFSVEFAVFCHARNERAADVQPV